MCVVCGVCGSSFSTCCCVWVFGFIFWTCCFCLSFGEHSLNICLLVSLLGPFPEHLFVVLESLGSFSEYLLFDELLGPFPEHFVFSWIVGFILSTFVVFVLRCWNHFLNTFFGCWTYSTLFVEHLCSFVVFSTFSEPFNLLFVEFLGPYGLQQDPPGLALPGRAGPGQAYAIRVPQTSLTPPLRWTRSDSPIKKQAPGWSA